jgi:hypothetical protein
VRSRASDGTTRVPSAADNYGRGHGRTPMTVSSSAHSVARMTIRPNDLAVLAGRRATALARRRGVAAVTAQGPVAAERSDG